MCKTIGLHPVVNVVDAETATGSCYLTVYNSRGEPDPGGARPIAPGVIANTGHGALGWTYAAGSAARVAALIDRED